MNLLTIAIDANLANPESSAAKRQKAYFPGWRHDILLLATGESRVVELAPNIRVYVSGGSNKFFALWNAARWLEKTEASYDLVSSQDPQFCGMLARRFAHQKHIPYVIQLHGNNLDNELWMKQRLINRLTNSIGKKLVQEADGVRCVSARLQKQVVESFGVTKEKTVSIPIGTPLEVFSSFGEKVDGKHVMFVGRLIEEKLPLLFCEIMIPIMKEMKDVKAVIAGSGDQEGEMRKRFADAGVSEQAVFLGQQPAEVLVKWYRSSICLLHTAAWEGWGMPMIEAMACGCPVVTTDTGCAGEAVIEGKNGFVTAIDDAAKMRDGVRTLLTNSALQRVFSEQAAKDAQAWSFDASAKAQLAFYQHVIENSRHGSRRTGRG